MYGQYHQRTQSDSGNLRSLYFFFQTLTMISAACRSANQHCLLLQYVASYRYCLLVTNHIIVYIPYSQRKLHVSHAQHSLTDRAPPQCTPMPSSLRTASYQLAIHSTADPSDRLNARDWLWQRAHNRTVVSIPLDSLNTSAPAPGPYRQSTTHIAVRVTCPPPTLPVLTRCAEARTTEGERVRGPRGWKLENRRHEDGSLAGWRRMCDDAQQQLLRYRLAWTATRADRSKQ